MTATFYVGDSIEVMGKLPESSVDLILTSPPFLALRSYLPADHPDKGKEGGSQPTPGAFIDWLLDVVEACERVLAPHGSLVFELGDTYSGSGGAGGDYNENGLRAGQPMFRAGYLNRDGRTTRQAESTGPLETWQVQPKGGTGWPLAKSLSLIPESFRWAMVYGHNPFTGRQTEPWRLRNVIRWVRPNPPVGALGDKFRPATSELMVFCKAKDRFFDLDAVREPFKQDEWSGGNSLKRPFSNSVKPDQAPQVQTTAGAPPLDWWNIPLLEGEEPTKGGPKPAYDPAKRRQQPVQQTTNHGGSKEARQDFGEAFYNAGNPLGAPPLDWWNIPPGGFSGAHYAVWPPELLIKPIKAMSPERVCKTCGEPSRRIVGDVEYVALRQKFTEDTSPGQGFRDASLTRGMSGTKAPAGRINGSETWSDCGHDDWRPGLVLDPFGGSGTTAAVATGHGRDCWLIDLDERNYELALDRVGPLVLTRGEEAK